MNKQITSKFKKWNFIKNQNKKDKTYNINAFVDLYRHIKIITFNILNCTAKTNIRTKNIFI